MTESAVEYKTEYCHVTYEEADNAVFLVWKKFCCFEDYRTPVRFALQLLIDHKNSNFIIDARNGFEDEKEDVHWGVNQFIPKLLKTDCKFVVFIMNEKNGIEGEIDLWTKAFMKHFTVLRVKSYQEAIFQIKHF